MVADNNKELRGRHRGMLAEGDLIRKGQTVYVEKTWEEDGMVYLKRDIHTYIHT